MCNLLYFTPNEIKLNLFLIDLDSESVRQFSLSAGRGDGCSGIGMTLWYIFAIVRGCIAARRRWRLNIS